jgi:outer membrane protein TolC
LLTSHRIVSPISHFAEQAVPVSGKNRSRARIAAAEAIIAFEETRRQELDVVAQTRAAYFQLANAYTQLELNRKNYESISQVAKISRANYETGKQTVADVLMSETEVTKIQESERDLERGLVEAQSQLNLLMNRDAFATLAAPSSLGLPMLPYGVDVLRAMTLATAPRSARPKRGWKPKKQSCNSRTARGYRTRVLVSRGSVTTTLARP